jgi:DNA processing protein
MLTDLKAWLWLTQQLELGPAWQVMQAFDSPVQAYFADPAEYELIPKLNPVHRQKLADKSLDRVEQLLADCDRTGQRVLTWQDTDYPERLRSVDLPPLVLYVRGKLPRLDEEIAIALAGTRHATPYGCKVAGELAFQITRLGGLVLTGIVEGCDRHAADAALKAGGPLVCVTAGGVDVPYYATDSGRQLLEDVAVCGALISASPPGTPHLPERFALRNRLMTALALGTVCIEAPERSGTLQVARLALEQGRDVYAVPANIDAPAGVGTNQLLSRGEAICVCSGADVLEHYWALYPQRRKARETLNPQEQEQRLEESKPQAETQAPEQPPSPTRRRSRTMEQEEASTSDAAPAQSAPQSQSAPLREIVLRKHRNEFTDDEQAVLRALEAGPCITDALVAATQLPARRVSATLTVLTIRSLVRQLPGGRFEALVRLC